MSNTKLYKLARKMIKRVFIPVVLFVLLLVSGTLFYHNVEGWRYLDSVYFSVVTVTTLGYGDLSPQTDAGKIFTMIFAFSGIGIAFYFFSLVGRYFLIKQRKQILKDEGRLINSKGIRRIK